MADDPQTDIRQAILLRRVGLCIAIFLFGLVVGRLWGWRPWGGERVTTALVSPDGGRVAVLVELPRMLDRNFVVRLFTIGEGPGRARDVFESPDEGRPVGTERFLWSRDGRWLLLLGRNFSVRQDTPVVGGETLYLLCDTSLGNIRCNASQTKIEGFGLADLEGLDFSLDFAKALAEVDVGAGVMDQ